MSIDKTRKMIGISVGTTLSCDHGNRTEKIDKILFYTIRFIIILTLNTPMKILQSILSRQHLYVTFRESCGLNRAGIMGKI